MRITCDLARYLLAVTTALDEGKPVPVTSTCTECEGTPNLFDEQHLSVLLGDGRTVVVVGCEGYFLVDPASVGLDRGNWQPAEHWMAAPAATDRPAPDAYWTAIRDATSPEEVEAILAAEDERFAEVWAAKGAEELERERSRTQNEPGC